jgi:hypothetical protein
MGSPGGSEYLSLLSLGDATYCIRGRRADDSPDNGVNCKITRYSPTSAHGE